MVTGHRDFEVDDKRIFYSLAALKGVGEAAVEKKKTTSWPPCGRRNASSKPGKGFLLAHRTREKNTIRQSASVTKA